MRLGSGSSLALFFKLIQGLALIAPRGEILVGCPMLKVHSWPVAKLACGTLVGYLFVSWLGLESGRWGASKAEVQGPRSFDYDDARSPLGGAERCRDGGYRTGIGDGGCAEMSGDERWAGVGGFAGWGA